ncbi:FoF1 ATP synthase subunit delta/epsilon [Wolbachia endosymbiont of Pentidionis agamae]|uniref:FoF1 ATP synthase subunit delta/epsilon n=1 Tax=Wolbachia endosymbiont of Pentidionis agamae TaxID=3110435 RepID=UPI002FD1BD12
MNTFKVQFISPDDQFVFNDVLSILVNGRDGEFMILADHAPYLIYALPGIITIKTLNKIEQKIVISSGILKVINNFCEIIVNEVHMFNS